MLHWMSNWTQWDDAILRKSTILFVFSVLLLCVLASLQAWISQRRRMVWHLYKYKKVWSIKHTLLCTEAIQKKHVLHIYHSDVNRNKTTTCVGFSTYLTSSSTTSDLYIRTDCYYYGKPRSSLRRGNINSIRRIAYSNCIYIHKASVALLLVGNKAHPKRNQQLPVLISFFFS